MYWFTSYPSGPVSRYNVPNTTQSPGSVPEGGMTPPHVLEQEQETGAGVHLLVFEVPLVRRV